MVGCCGSSDLSHSVSGTDRLSRCEMHRWVLHLPLYTRLVTCLVTVSPIVASVLYYLYAPWEGDGKVVVYAWLGTVVFAVFSSFYEVHFRVSRKGIHSGDDDH